MNSPYQKLRAHPKAAISLIAAVLAVIIATGWEVTKLSSSLRQLTRSNDGSGSPGSVGKLSPDTIDPQLEQVIVRYRLSRQTAPYLSKTKLRVISETNTSVHYLLTFPDGVTSDETVTITSGQKYSPSLAELTRSNRSGKHVVHPILSAKQVGPKETLFTLRYYLPENELPPEIQQRIHAAAQARRRGFFNLVPSAWAQEGSGDNGAGFVTWNVVELVKSMDVKQFENMEWEKSAKVLDNILTARDLVNGFNEISNWLGEIAELKDCAEHPTNPLTQKASSDKDYEKVLDGLNDAEWNIQMTAFPKVANIAAGAVTQELPFGTGVLISPITAANDQAIEQIAEDEIADARKNVVPCDMPMTPGDLRPMEGTLEYIYIRKSDKAEEKREANGKFELIPKMGGLQANGTADYTYEFKAMSINPICTGIAEHAKAKGPTQINGVGGGTPFGGVIELHVNGDLPVEDTLLVGNGANHCIDQTRNFQQNYNFICHFDHVDMVKGGTFSTFTKDEGGNGTCRIELSRK